MSYHKNQWKNDKYEWTTTKCNNIYFLLRDLPFLVWGLLLEASSSSWLLRFLDPLPYFASSFEMISSFCFFAFAKISVFRSVPSAAPYFAWISFSALSASAASFFALARRFARSLAGSLTNLGKFWTSPFSM